MGKTTAAVKNRYNRKAYERLNIVIPNGRKGTIQARAGERGESVNGYVTGLIRADLGLTADAWKRGEIR